MATQRWQAWWGHPGQEMGLRVTAVKESQQMGQAAAEEALEEALEEELEDEVTTEEFISCVVLLNLVIFGPVTFFTCGLEETKAKRKFRA